MTVFDDEVEVDDASNLYSYPTLFTIFVLSELKLSIGTGQNPQARSDSLTAEIYTGTLANISSGLLYKRGNDVHLNSLFGGSFSNGSVITTLPEGYRPKNAITFVSVAKISTNNLFLSTKINTDGTIVAQTSNTWTSVLISITFPIDV